MRAADLTRVVDTMHRAQHGALQVRACVRDAQEHVARLAEELEAIGRIHTYATTAPARTELVKVNAALLALQGHLDHATGELVSDLRTLAARDDSGF